MVYELRSRKNGNGEKLASGGEQNGLKRKITFLHWRDKESKRPRPLPESEGRRVFGMFQEQAQAQPLEQGQDVARPDNPQGSEVKTIAELRAGSQDYLKIRATDFPNLYFLVRRKSDLNAHHLGIRECEFDIHCMLPRELENITLNGFIESLWDLFDVLFDSFVNSQDFQEICFHVTHKDLVGSLSSSIYELLPENKNIIISEILSRLTGWNESSRPGSSIRFGSSLNEILTLVFDLNSVLTCRLVLDEPKRLLFRCPSKRSFCSCDSASKKCGRFRCAPCTV